jgi:TonB-linked SusC/RagA family outer membrane protein
MKKHLLVLLLVAGGLGFAYAQRTITGKVTDVAGEPLIGASVLVKGSGTGSVTDLDGAYQLEVPSGTVVLVFSYTGFTTKEVTTGTSSVLDVTLEEGILLEEAVVTALGIKRSEKSVPFAVQQVGEEQLNIIRPTNINNALAGKVAGVQIRSQSTVALDRGAGIRIRGAGSLSDKQPLYVIDGTPVTNSIDFNMDDVESVSVLKGPSATAIYGQRGDAGVIVITTKKGGKAKGLGIEFNHSTFFDNVYILPKYQNEYAGGGVSELIQFNWKQGMPEEWKVFEGKFYHDYSDDASWGPKMSGQEYIPWYAWYVGTPRFGQTAQLVGQPDNIRNFFETSTTKLNNLNFRTAGEGYNLRLSLTNQDVNGMLPNTSQSKYTVATQANVDLGKNFTLGANINYVTSQTKGEFDDAYANQSSGSFNQWFHRNLDMNILKEMRNVRSPQGWLASWNHNNPDDYLTGARNFYAGNYWYNFYSYFDNLENVNNRQRLFGDVSLTYKLNDKFKVAGFLRRNQNTTNYENKVYNILQTSGTQTGIFNGYGTGLTFFSEDNYEFLSSYNNKFGIVSVEANLGANIRQDRSKQITGASSNGLNVPDLFTVANSKVQTSPGEYREQKEVRSIYGRGSFGFKDLFYVDWSVRNDWSSALPAGNNSYFYPSIGASFVFSELLSGSMPWLSFGKVRGSWAQVGSDLSPYLLSLNYGVSANQFNGNFLMGTPDRQVDPNIEPALSSGFELGLDLRVFNNRLGLSATYYNESKINEILTVPVTSASGFTSRLINAGQIDRSGVELQLTATPVKTRMLNWDVSVNFATIQNQIVELTEGIDAQVVSGSSFSTRTGVVQVNQVGEEWGQLRGGAIKRDDQGRPILDASGLFTAVPNSYFGSVLPDFTGGIFNSVGYKNLFLNFNIDFSKGGKYFSLSDSWGVFSGLFERTAVLNDNGKNVRESVASGGGVRVDGVAADGTPVTKYVPAQTYYQQFYSRRIAEPFIYDLDFVKLREVSLGYQVPVSKIGGLGKYVQGMSIAFVARNPWLIYSQNRDFDPSEMVTTYGENGQFPGTRSFGFNIKFNF